ncbi:putative wall-associated receptor kinase-like 16 [Prunus yedoensis var. nudiflora]|uniref:Putative wall-associated receptor kinase-like 16 n=1 Tax=Prunus yedoensis var. nudiflora TaxID=2094558 RepID=A0A314Z6B1_PRUYE|nr:putative wall-associated receptor kinase-like 16 [Prunus yedoensis var. nudiflora]
MITCPKFSAKVVEKATNTKGVSKIIRKGISTSVYKGVLPDKTVVETLIEKLDVYGIGIVLAELLTRPNAISSSGDGDLTKLAKSFLLRVEEDRLKEILDDKIVEEGDFETTKKVAQLATRCLRYEKEEMPSMKEVVAELEGILHNLRAQQGGQASCS